MVHTDWFHPSLPVHAPASKGVELAAQPELCFNISAGGTIRKSGGGIRRSRHNDDHSVDGTDRDRRARTQTYCAERHQWEGIAKASNSAIQKARHDGVTAKGVRAGQAGTEGREVTMYLEGPSRFFVAAQVKYNGTEKEKTPFRACNEPPTGICTSQVETPLTVADEFRVSASLGTPGIRRNSHHVVGRHEKALEKKQACL
ncbi:hypothetical protein C8R43DRAFT_950032 [Mycena crocata]|nr:hypothetical protein C8R43DRAFT_950032 [Mycena crocata]